MPIAPHEVTLPSVLLQRAINLEDRFRKVGAAQEAAARLVVVGVFFGKEPEPAFKDLADCFPATIVILPLFDSNFLLETRMSIECLLENLR